MDKNLKSFTYFNKNLPNYLFEKFGLFKEVIISDLKKKSWQSKWDFYRRRRHHYYLSAKEFEQLATKKFH